MLAATTYVQNVLFPPCVRLESLLGSVLGMILFNKDDWGWGLSIEQCFVLNGVFPLLFIGPWVIQLRETRSTSLEQTTILDRIRTQASALRVRVDSQDGQVSSRIGSLRVPDGCRSQRLSYTLWHLSSSRPWDFVPRSARGVF